MILAGGQDLPSAGPSSSMEAVYAHRLLLGS